MRNTLEAVAGTHKIYTPRREEFNTGEKIPFRVSPVPLTLSPSEARRIGSVGQDMGAFFSAADKLYQSDDTVRALLNRGKPEIYLKDAPTRYAFIRPDIMLTNKGFTVCEIETSPFGLGLAEILNRGYQREGFGTLVEDGALKKHLQMATPPEGTIVFSQKTASYQGQMEFLAEQVLSGEQRSWNVKQAREGGDSAPAHYRGYYLSEYLTDPAVKSVTEQNQASQVPLIPSATPHMEEKALMALLWDKRYEDYFAREVGSGAFRHLRDLIPPTWIVGQEEYFSPGLPNGMQVTADLAGLPKSQRQYVLKESGFSSKSSWGEGVVFLHKKSTPQVEELTRKATEDTQTLYVVQAFEKARDIPMAYEEDGAVVPMTARVRITPYYDTTQGDLVGIKATGGPNTTDYIHGTSHSINTAVSQAA